jgi:hypothetical protein
VAHLRSRAQGTEGIVLVRDRHAEDRYHRIPDELLDRAAVRFHDRLHPLEVAGQEALKRFRVGRLSEGCRPDHVAEEDRYDLPVRRPSSLAPRDKAISPFPLPRAS